VAARFVEMLQLMISRPETARDVATPAPIPMRAATRARNVHLALAPSPPV
jgi:hypothetical protein